MNKTNIISGLALSGALLFAPVHANSLEDFFNFAQSVDDQQVIDLGFETFTDGFLSLPVANAANASIAASLFESAGFSIGEEGALAFLELNNTIALNDSLTDSELESLLRDFAETYLGGNFVSASELSSLGSTPGTTALRTSEAVIRSQLFDVAKTKQQKEAEKAASGSTSGVSFDSDVYYNKTEFVTGTDAKSYGANLSATFGEKYEITATLPISHTEFGDLDYTTYGLDLATLIDLNDNFSIGGHINYLATSGDVDRDSFTLGPVGSATFDLSETLILSFGALLDRVEVEDADEEWVGAFGVNLGFAVSDNFAVNPYVIYYKNFDQDFGDDDWFDLGIEGSVALGSAWSLTAGIKITEDYDPIDDSWEFYLGSGFSF